MGIHGIPRVSDTFLQRPKISPWSKYPFTGNKLPHLSESYFSAFFIAL